ncbi:GDSL-type esterase/lipase family protein [Streptomyces sp. TRM 70351]|uniref:GDSL-type esterase/lipase family protein n=1 Tax=Streptomyces sp. TRM 70351 TaxID=3116552 RepID=UPI002E7C2A70|nr:GDSL-type esterase/lipase family protein [Streptomyces sp. TRM 70351]MEE1929587.1 GDSL-type esterase/lipase family protein [Streptomyces sp. TRM 70351]
MLRLVLLRPRQVRSALRLIAVGLAGALVVCGLTVPAHAGPGAIAEASSSCGLPGSLAASGGARAVQTGAFSPAAPPLEADCGDAASTRFTALQAAADDVVISMRVDDLDPRHAQEFIDEEVEQYATLGDFVRASLDEHAEYLPETPGEWIDFDGRLQVDADVLHLVVPGPETAVEWAWWYSLFAGAVYVLTGIAVTALCLAAATVVAPPFLPVCVPLSSFIAGFVSSLVNSRLNNGQLDLRALNDAFWTGAANTALTVVGEVLAYKYAQTMTEPLLKKVGEALVRAGDSALKWAGERGAASVRFAREVLDNFRATAGEILLEWARRRGLEVVTSGLRVMPLGDSITAGVGSTDDAGYRNDLWYRLDGAARSLDFVGSRREGEMSDGHNEGHRGRRIDEVARIAECSVPAWRPNVVTLHVGTNDVNQDYDLDGAPERIGGLVDQILEDSPGAVVLVATLVPATKAGMQPEIDRINARLPGIVQERAEAGERVRLVSMAALTTADLFNAAHPNDAGYAKMADAWYDGIMAAAADGWIEDTRPGSGQECGGGEDGSQAGPGWHALGVIAPGMSAPSGRTDLVDLNADDRADYVRVAADGSVRAALNTQGEPGKPQWQDQGVIIAAPPGETDAGARVRFADIDGNGTDDYLLVDDDSSVRAWYTSASSFKLQYAGVIAPGVSGAAGASIRFADVDGDGRDDYLRVGEDGFVHAYVNTPKDPGGNAIGWVEHRNWAPGVAYGSRGKLRLADVNGDGRDDYLMVGNTGAVHAYLNDGLGNGFTEHRFFVNETGYPGERATFRDISGDGKADYVVVYHGGSVRAWLNRGGNLNDGSTGNPGDPGSGGGDGNGAPGDPGSGGGDGGGAPGDPGDGGAPGATRVVVRGLSA